MEKNDGMEECPICYSTSHAHGECELYDGEEE